jgi:valyl-tRNA synthetase
MVKMNEQHPSKPAELAKAYEAKTIDSKWYEFWEKSGFFHADENSSKPPFCIVIPPPNVTGVLHMGHALVNTLQDVLIRWKRMSGFETLWVPGTDHAGIATQTVVERHLIKTTGKKRKDYSREDFLELVWDWKEKNENLILGQLKRLGSSCDWSRLRFTMDDGNNAAVRKIFKKLYDDKLIYRGNYLVNWDPVTQTALADDEVEYEENQSFLWHFKYPLKNGTGFVHIATTRPETMLGDTAIAVSPKDARYAHLIGEMVMLPLMNREIPIISDYLVDPEFGTGMVKVTPAHDPNDYQMGLTHKLPFVNIMTPDGKINENGREFAGLTMEEARLSVIKEMEALNLVEKIEPHVNRVGISYRSKAVIQPYMSKQWFVKMTDFADHLRKAVKSGKTSIIPKSWENSYFHWIDNLRDWCISRQLWWGHRIPIWTNIHDPEQIICFDGEGLPEEVKNAPNEWVQDEDVLDTWFSSALWPFATLGWPEKTAELEKFYPNAVLVTGNDILFFWVARMIMMGEYVMGEVPFPKVFLHGLIYGKSYWRQNATGGITYVNDQERMDYDLGKPVPKDVISKWEKMSKSKGNVIDPIEIIEEYGTDAMRMTLCSSPTESREIDLDRRKFEEYKNFANKMWNGARFIFMNLDGNEAQNQSPLTPEEFKKGLDLNELTLEDSWILSRLNRTISEVNIKLSQYSFDVATSAGYNFFWNEFCAYYLEIAKPVLFEKLGTAANRKNKQKLLAIILCQSIRLLHPMIPFITEELFQTLKSRLCSNIEVSANCDPYTKEAIIALDAKACMVTPFPKVISETDQNQEIDKTFELARQMVYLIRNIRGEMKLPPGAASDVYIVGEANDPDLILIQNNLSIISALVRTNVLEVRNSEPELKSASSTLLNSLKVIIPIPDELLKQEIARLGKEKERLTLSFEKIKAQLDNEDFVKRAPPQLIEKQNGLLIQTEKELNEIHFKMKQFV